MIESNSPARLARITDEELKTAETGLSELATMLTDPEKTEPLMLVTKYYRDFFEDFWYACFQLSKYENVTYLIDFDVLREYLEVDSIQNFGSLILESLFTESSMKYAIPAGALNELLDYVKKLTRTTRGLSSLSLDVHEPSYLVRQIAELMGVEDARDAEVEDLADRTNELLAHTSVRLRKLHEILTNQRFLGVVGLNDTQDRDRLKYILDRMPRPPAARSKKDDRDAINLAITIGSTRAQRSKRKKSAYILLTNTRIVQKLPGMILEHVQDPKDRADLLSQLGAILGVEEKDHKISRPEGPDFSLVFPAMHPLLAINAEMQGVFENSGLILGKVERLQNEYQKVNNFLRHQATGLKGGPTTSAGMIREFRTELSDEVTQSLKEISTEMLSVRARGHNRIEQRRATALSVAYSRQEQSGRPISPHDKITQESTNVLKLFGKVLAAIEGTAGFRYVVEEEPPDDSRPFGLFKVLQEPGPDRNEPLATGEKYLLELSDSQPGFFAIRWPVACRPERFLNAMRRLIVPMVNGQQAPVRASRKGFTLKRIGDPELKNQGVIVFANDRAFGCRLNAILSANQWHHLNLSYITPLLKEFLDEDSREQGRKAHSIPRVQQYRVNTMFGDFIFDIEPAEDGLRRYFTIISHYNLGRQAAMLYMATGLLYVFPEKLAATLTPLLEDFPDPLQGES